MSAELLLSRGSMEPTDLHRPIEETPPVDDYREVEKRPATFVAMAHSGALSRHPELPGMYGYVSGDNQAFSPYDPRGVEHGGLDGTIPFILGATETLQTMSQQVKNHLTISAFFNMMPRTIAPTEIWRDERTQAAQSFEYMISHAQGLDFLLPHVDSEEFAQHYRTLDMITARMVAPPGDHPHGTGLTTDDMLLQSIDPEYGNKLEALMDVLQRAESQLVAAQGLGSADELYAPERLLEMLDSTGMRAYLGYRVVDTPPKYQQLEQQLKRAGSVGDLHRSIHDIHWKIARLHADSLGTVDMGMPFGDGSDISATRSFEEILEEREGDIHDLDSRERHVLLDRRYYVNVRELTNEQVQKSISSTAGLYALLMTYGPELWHSEGITYNPDGSINLATQKGLILVGKQHTHSAHQKQVELSPDYQDFASRMQEDDIAHMIPETIPEITERAVVIVSPNYRDPSTLSPQQKQQALHNIRTTAAGWMQTYPKHTDMARKILARYEAELVSKN